ncbi:MAG: DUF2238 domain-containing protein [Rhodospirillaceae bacterium]|jgi:putative membrane protein|nr:DUF2238 domain-containing protein [Rhodospirillaceae bacterium]MBT5751921.1 DUF2238 domain-containing protein [Rhodospirillaceae bacterium]
MPFTTATSPRIENELGANRPLAALLVVYGMIWAGLALTPYNRFDWCLENMLVIITIIWLAITYSKRPFSDLSYFLLFVFLVLHGIGAHYTYSLVPFGFDFGDAIGETRNHYDRLIHFAFGLLILYPFREKILRGSNIRGFWLGFLAFAIIMTFSVCYEVIEWLVAEIVDPENAQAYLGTQGDVFDAEKDSALAGLGSFIALTLIFFLERKKT